jgi:hypothetical protein
MEDRHSAAAATLAVAILENQPDLPNGRVEKLKGKAYEDRLIEAYFEVLKKLQAS